MKLIILAITIALVSCSMTRTQTFRNIVNEELNEKQNELTQNLTKIYKDNKSELKDIGLLQFTFMSWETIVCETQDYDNLGTIGSFGYCMQDLISHDIVYDWADILSEDNDVSCDYIYFELVYPWFKKSWDQLKPEDKSHNAIVMLHDGSYAYWLNKGKVIRFTDANLRKLFNIKD